MKMLYSRIVLLSVMLVSASAIEAYGQQNTYSWFSSNSSSAVADRIAPPAGFERIPVAAGSFADWLRHLPLKSEGSSVFLFDGTKKWNQSVHVAVIDIDTGTRDLQQCADAVMRLRAEYLYSKGMFNSIKFNFTSGDPAFYIKWRDGYRPKVTGNSVTWIRKFVTDHSYVSFRKYLNTVFMYAGSYSLSRELAQKSVEKMQIGDVFIQGGFPGHAVLAIDMAQNAVTGEKLFLLAQSYMPAQDIHVLRNPNDSILSPWYPIHFGETLRTPEWTFEHTDLKSFPPN